MACCSWTGCLGPPPGVRFEVVDSTDLAFVGAGTVYAKSWGAHDPMIQNLLHAPRTMMAYVMWERPS